MERVDTWRRSSPEMRALTRATVVLDGGPHNGWTYEYDLAPDYFEAHGGRYLSLLSEPTRYVWAATWLSRPAVADSPDPDREP